MGKPKRNRRKRSGGSGIGEPARENDSPTWNPFRSARERKAARKAKRGKKR